MSQNEGMIHFDVDDEIAYIKGMLNAMQNKAPSILKNSINAAARKVRKQIVKDVQGKYAIKDKSILKKESEGAPQVATASPANLSAEIFSRGSMQDIMSFMTRPNEETGAAAAKVFNSGSFKYLEMGGLRAFVTTFASGHTAIVQRKTEDSLPIKKLLSPAVPMLLGNEEIRNAAETEAYDIIQQEITKRIDKINAG